jgi:glycosyltransferase involved in cell wall biosynthesis
MAGARDMPEDGREPTILMLCAHEPTLDPRIRWEAEAAAARFDVLVLGFNRDDGSLPIIADAGHFRIARLSRRDFGVAYYFWLFKDLLPRSVKIAAIPVGLLLIPLLLGIEVLGRLFVFARRLGRAAIGRVGKKRFRTLRMWQRMLPLREIGQRVRARLISRICYILAVMRVQFSPASVLFWEYIVSMPKKPTVIHCNDLDTLLVGVLSKKHFGCRVIYDAHEYYPVSDPYGNWLDVKFFGLIEGFLIRRVDAAVTVNPMLAAIMRRTYQLDRVYAVPNTEPWSEGRRYAANALPQRPMHRLADGRVKFLFQGRFTPARGIDELIDAWARVDGSKAALFLRGPDNMWRRRSMERAEALGVLDRSLYFIDAVSEDELVAAASEADIGIIPYLPAIINDRFSCPNKLSQYLHAGLMILCNELPYVKSVVAEADAGLCYDSSDPSSFVAAVVRITDNPELLRECRKNALCYARERFNWQTQGAVLLKLYDGTLLEQEQQWITAPREARLAS